MLNFLLSRFVEEHGGVEEFRQPKQQQPMNEQEHPYTQKAANDQDPNPDSDTPRRLEILYNFLFFTWSSPKCFVLHESQIC